MKTEGNNTFQAVYRLTGQIPYGRVTTYGQLARLIGNPRLSRIVGCALNAAPEGLPCHRVVNRDGRLCPSYTEQRELLAAEGVCFLPDGRVDMTRFSWP